MNSMVEYLTDMGQIGQEYGYREYEMYDNDASYDHVTKVIRMHPKYFEHYIKTHRFIMYEDGPLSYQYRNYLAIMAAARHKNVYLINLHEKEFLLQGGDPAWLNGLEHIPVKLRAITEIIKILAHRPWLLTKEHIERLTKGQQNWSMSEVVHAIVLLAHIHSLSSFVFSCGLTQQLDSSQTNASKTMIEQQQLQQQQQPVTNQIVHNNQILELDDRQNGIAEVDNLMRRMQDLSEQKNLCSDAELRDRFKNVELQAAEISTNINKLEVPQNISHYLDDPDYTYQDFARRGAENVPHTFRVQDYSWDDHGYSLVNRLYNDVGFLLDDKFRVAYNLTYYTIAGRQNVDTSKFRRAIWNYIQCLYGIRHDDYDYNEVNQLLDKPLKTFIKTACCFPERITKRDYDSILLELQDSEKVHVNLLILEAKNQSILLYTLREIMRYMT